MTDRSRRRATLVTAAATLALAWAGACSDSITSTAPSAKPIANDSVRAMQAALVNLDADVAALDARILDRQRAWFTLEPQSTAALLAERHRLAAALARLRARAGDQLTTRGGIAAIIEPGEGGEAAPAVDGSHSASIPNQNAKVNTWLLWGPPQGCDAELAHWGSYSGSVKHPGGDIGGVSGDFAKRIGVINMIEDYYAMPVSYDAAKDTVNLTVRTYHGGKWFAQSGASCTGGTMQTVSKTSSPYYAAPAPPPPEPPRDSTVNTGGGGGGGGGGGEGGCQNVEEYYIDHYWYYPDTGEIEYRYTETKYYCADQE